MTCGHQLHFLGLSLDKRLYQGPDGKYHNMLKFARRRNTFNPNFLLGQPAGMMP